MQQTRSLWRLIGLKGILANSQSTPLGAPTKTHRLCMHLDTNSAIVQLWQHKCIVLSIVCCALPILYPYGVNGECHTLSLSWGASNQCRHSYVPVKIRGIEISGLRAAVTC